MNSISQPRRQAVATTLTIAALAIAGCGGSSSSSTGSKASSQDAARVKSAQCLRQHGVNVPDNPGQNGGPAAFRNIDQAKFRAAQQACQKYQRAAVANISPSQQQAFRDAFTKFSSCMRQHGVELPDPGSGNGPPAGGQINSNDPKVKAARQACQSKLPRGGPGGGAPGGG